MKRLSKVLISFVFVILFGLAGSAFSYARVIDFHHDQDGVSRGAGRYFTDQYDDVFALFALRNTLPHPARSPIALPGAMGFRYSNVIEGDNDFDLKGNSFYRQISSTNFDFRELREGVIATIAPYLTSSHGLNRVGGIEIAIDTVGAGGNDPVNPVPEPATMLLFGAGLAGLAGISIRRKRK